MSDHDNDTCPHLVRASLLEAENARLKTEVQHLMIFCNSTLIPSKELQAENARLKAEVERLNSLCDNLGMGGKHTIMAIMEENARLKAEVERLADENARLTMMKDACKRMIKRRDKWILEKRAEVERLRKAGDAMAVGTLKYIEPTDGYLTYLECRANWNAAKEGKPSV